MFQVLKALEHMHNVGIFHRDIKPENILLLDETVKLADLGSCRGIFSKQPYTEYISTRWYRAPECLLTDGYYNYKMDLWGVGCVLFEVLALFPLFPGNNELDQIHKIHNILGTPPKAVLDQYQKFSTHMDFNFQKKDGTGISQLIPHVSQEGQDVIIKLLAYNPNDRPNAKQILNHPYFKDLKVQTKNNIPGTISPGKDNSKIEDSGSEDSPVTGKKHTNNSLLGGEKSKAKGKVITDLKANEQKQNSSSESEDQLMPNVYE